MINIREMVKCALCRLGIHLFEKEPSQKELIKSTGLHVLFFSEGMQKGTRVCTRVGCGATQKVWRCGWVGVGGQGTPWKELTPEHEAYIDSLPVL